MGETTTLWLFKGVSRQLGQDVILWLSIYIFTGRFGDCNENND